MTRRGLALGLLGLALGCPAATVTTHERPSTPPPVAEDGGRAGGTEAVIGGLPVTLLPARPGEFEATLLVDAGDDPAGLPGLGAFVADAAILATRRDPDRDLRPQRRAMVAGGELSPVHGRAAVGWRVRGPIDAAPSLLQLLLDVALEPSFPATRVRTLAESQRESRQLERQDYVRQAVDWTFALLVGARQLTTDRAPERSLLALHREDVVRHHARLVQAAHARLIVRGAERRALAHALADRAFPGAAQRPASRRCAARGDRQGFISAPRGERGLAVGVMIPGDPGVRQATVALVVDRHSRDRGDVMPVISASSDGPMLILWAPGPLEVASAQIDRWLAGLMAEASAAQVRVGRRIIAAGLAPEGWTGLRRGPQTIDPVALNAALRRLSDSDAHTRVAVGDRWTRDSIASWGPTITLRPTSRLPCTPTRP